jgi:phenylpyruvate tautomerase PptA (4-oxalocrotonate tautomerase family)
MYFGKGALTEEQKSELSRKVTDLMSRKKAATTLHLDNNS